MNGSSNAKDGSSCSNRRRRGKHEDEEPALSAPGSFFSFPPPPCAGLYYSGEQYAELPSRLRGFLIDHRALRAAARERPGDVPATPLRDDYRAAAERLEKLAKARALSADEAADLGALYLRLGKLDRHLAYWSRPPASTPAHFHLAANLGTAFQLSGDLDRAARVPL